MHKQFLIFVQSSGFLAFNNGLKYYTLQIEAAQTYETLLQAEIAANCVLNRYIILQNESED